MFSQYKKYLELYLDTGNGFNEENSIKIEFSQNLSYIRFKLSGFDNIRAINFKPLNDSLIIKIRGFKIIYENGESRNLSPIEYINISSEGNLFYSITNNPQIIFNLPSLEHAFKPIEFIADIEYLRVGSESLRELALTREKNIKELTENYENKIKLITSGLQIVEGIIPFAMKLADARLSRSKLSDVLDLLLPEPKVPFLTIDKPIDILIPVFNSLEYLDSLFDSIKRNTSVPYRLLIANDNDSVPETSIWLHNFKDNNPDIDITIIENDGNLRGFVRKINRLAKLTRNHFVILNTDTEVPPYWLERLIFPIVDMENIASATPFTNSGTLCSFPIAQQDNTMFENLDVGSLDSYFQYVNFKNSFVEIPTGVGFCMAINRKVYEEIGMFDEAFGMGYGEENDWCMRAFNLGYKNIIVPNLFVYHKHGGSFTSKEKEDQLKENAKLLEKKHPEYKEIIEEHIKIDPLNDLRNILQIKILCDLYNPEIILDHNQGGGTNEYSNILISDKKIALIIKNISIGLLDNLNIYSIEFILGSSNKISYQINNLNNIYEIINILKIKNIFINTLVFQQDILNLINFLINLKINNPNINYIYAMHDFFCICPNYNLVDYQFQYCDVPGDLNYCRKCLRANQLMNSYYVLMDYPNLTITLWRENFGFFLDKVNKIICFSNNSAEILKKAYPAIPNDKIEINPHRVEWVRPANIVKKDFNVLNIAVIGNINIQKGAHIIYILANYALVSNLNIRFHVFGDILIPIGTKYSNITIHGQYNKKELPILMEQNSIDIILIPSIWPETFSYTTEEAIKMEMPVAVFNLGAPAERVKHYKRGIILTGYEPDYIIKTLLQYNELIN